MQKLFSLDGKVFRTLSLMFDLLVLNLLFLVTSLPIVTIGPSMVALYSVTIKIIKKEESYVTRNYFDAFRENLKKALGLWLIELIGIILIIGSASLIYSRVVSPLFLFPILLVTAFLLLTGQYFYPLTAYFENTYQNTLRTALFINGKYTLYSVILFLLTILSVLLPIFLPKLLLLWLCLGFSVAAYGKTYIYLKIFEKIQINSLNGETI